MGAKNEEKPCECATWAWSRFPEVQHHPHCGGPNPRALSALRELVRAVEYEASQGDGIHERMQPAYDGAKAEIARLESMS